MAPITDELVHFPKMFVSTTKLTGCSCQKQKILSDFSVPICRRGIFLQDSFFEDALIIFEKAVKDVLERWGARKEMTVFQQGNGKCLLNNLNQYRKLKYQHQIKDQVLSVATDGDSHKILLDVAGFMDGVVRVRVVGETQVVVEACKKTNQHSENGPSHTFRKEFSLPQDTSVKDIISVISSDGILMITAPKNKNKKEYSNATIIPIKIDRLANKTVTVPTSPCPSCLKSPPLTINIPIQSMKSPTSPFPSSTVNNTLKSPFEKQVTPFTTPFLPMVSTIPPLPSLESHITSLASPFTQLKPTSSDFSSDMSSLLSHSSPIPSPFITLPPFSTPSMSPLTPAFTQTKHLGRPALKNAVNTLESALKSKMQQKNMSNTFGLSFLKLPVLPIPQLGRFFCDPFFKDSWQDFEEAVKEVVSKWGDLGSSTDNLASYRTLRAKDLTDENQAVKASEDHHNYKFLVDVQDFTDGGEIAVKFVNPRELVVEGHVENNNSDTEANTTNSNNNSDTNTNNNNNNSDTNNKTTKKFLQRFVLPGDVDVVDASSVMSADGVLTVMAPKQTSNPAVRERVVPVTLETKHEGTESYQPSNCPLGLVIEREPRVTSPTLSVMSDESSGSLGTLWTCTQPLHQGVTIEEI